MITCNLSCLSFCVLPDEEAVGTFYSKIVEVNGSVVNTLVLVHGFSDQSSTVQAFRYYMNICGQDIMCVPVLSSRLITWSLLGHFAYYTLYTDLLIKKIDMDLCLFYMDVGKDCLRDKNYVLCM